MQTSERDGRIALQPETEVEQRLLGELFTHLNNTAEEGGRVYFTLDVPQYGGLDHDLWRDADCPQNADGSIAPEPGSRALVVNHGMNEGEV